MILGKIVFCLFYLAGAADTYQLSYQLANDTGDFTTFSSLLKKSQWTSIEQFLTDWKKEKPEFFSNYVMAYRSRSLQQSSFENPRIILFNQNADFVFTFNGDSKHRGFNNIEMMRFDHAQNKFEFYELSFQNQKAQLSEANPKKCLECHQSSQRVNVDPRPNWEPYNAWLGFYGSLDDSTELFKTNFNKQKHFNPDTDRFLLAEFESEPVGFDTFWNNVRPTHPRYSTLLPIVNANYANEKTLNGDLTNRLSALNMRRVVRLIQENKPLYDYIKWTIWSFGMCGQTFSASESVREWLMATTPLKEFSEIETSTLKCLPRKNECTKKATTKVTPSLRFTDVVNMVIETVHVNTEDWSMDFKTGGRFAAFERFGLTNDPRPPLRAALERLFAVDPDFKDMTCKEASARSLENFGDLQKVQNFYASMLSNKSPVLATKPLIQRCISCHVDEAGFDIPAIPFDNPEKLRSALKTYGFKRGTLLEEIEYRTGAHAGSADQMPPRGVPSETQRKELIQYLKSLLD